MFVEPSLDDFQEIRSKKIEFIYRNVGWENILMEIQFMRFDYSVSCNGKISKSNHFSRAEVNGNSILILSTLDNFPENPLGLKKTLMLPRINLPVNLRANWCNQKFPNNFVIKNIKKCQQFPHPINIRENFRIQIQISVTKKKFSLFAF